MDWHGEAAEKLRSATHADLQTTDAAVDQLQAAARVARNGASDLHAARSRVHYAVEDARTAGFEVGEDLSVTDRMTGGSVAQRAARQAAAQSFAGDLRQRAAQLVSLDQQVAGKITAAVAGIRDTFPQNSAPVASPPAPNGRIQAVNHTWKQDGGNGQTDPSPPDPPARGLPPEGLHPPVDGSLTPARPAAPANEVSAAKVCGMSTVENGATSQATNGTIRIGTTTLTRTQILLGTIFRSTVFPLASVVLRRSSLGCRHGFKTLRRPGCPDRHRTHCWRRSLVRPCPHPHPHLPRRRALA